ncbi:hypothetical protein [Mesorhizobium amorphae]|uniref:Uncharacterized protein n=1 Tax=Mesorhizobium amorphae CCNWGS0123 TaxID=1082933 RepID=G6Y3J6_9HYPH|nr:hypothetical protein [Mesorhizobium amorphae]ANT48501.1 hypothetical protein A6B35_00385 [Mesorhizobium amorphae CCNWGS0123]EHH13704.1 hypothetical protein MEA186_02462 [Mesorhizobium amorphae CCNWGS0123]GLR41723.1 hypothetical protein GCM10007880_22390 [Mesorhizobium amorphae]
MTKIACLGRRGILISIGLIGAFLGAAAAQAAEPNKAELDALKQSLAKYEDYKAAIRDLYLSTVGCVSYSGEKIPGTMDYPKGAMGIHFVNVPSIGPTVDPMRPNVLIYEPVGNELRLVGVEWLVPLTPDTKAPPELFGQKFMGPMEGHYPLIPKEFHHYDLHAWLFKDNPDGMFSPTNPEVKCDGYAFPMPEQPTKMVPGPM